MSDRCSIVLLEACELDSPSPLLAVAKSDSATTDYVSSISQQQQLLTHHSPYGPTLVHVWHMLM